MRKLIVGAAALAASLSLFACLTTPEDSDSSTNQALHCASGQRAFNGACRDQCTTSADCRSGLACMSAGGANLCLDYDHCSYLESDTACESTSGGGGWYDPYVWWNSYYGFRGGTCIGNARWVTVAAKGDPKCGQAHPVTRCRPTPQGCGFVSGHTVDVPEP